MSKIKLGNVLTVIVIALACVAVLIVALGQFQYDREEYQSYIKYTFTRQYLQYDYSCDQSVYGLYIVLTNSGDKTVQNLQVSVTNGLCVGAIPPLPSALNASQSIQFYVYTTVPNGTVTVTGNNTDLSIGF